MRRQFILGITFLLVQQIFSQSDFRDGFVITKSRDTLYGLVDYKEGYRGYRICNFKQDKDQKTISYTADQIQAYGFTNDLYFESNEYNNVDNEPEIIFFQVLVKGNATLYKYHERYYVAKMNIKPHELVSTFDDSVIDGLTYRKDNKEYIRSLNYLFFDCEKLRKGIENLKFNEPSLVKIVKDYNNCQGVESVAFNERKPLFKMVFGVAIGYNFSSIGSDGFDENNFLKTDFSNSNSLMFGATFDLSSPRWLEKISLTGGLFYFYSDYFMENTSKPYESNIKNEVTIEISQLKIPLGFRYTFPEKKITPYINIGGSFTAHLSSSAVWLEEREFFGKVTITETDLEIGDHQFGYWGGVGFKVPIHNKMKAFFEFRYESNQSSSFEKVAVNEENSFENYQLIVGINL